MTAQMNQQKYKIVRVSVKILSFYQQLPRPYPTRHKRVSYRDQRLPAMVIDLIIAKIRSVFSHDAAILNQQTTPGDDRAVIIVVITDNREFGLVMSARIRITNFSRLTNDRSCSWRYSDGR